MTTAIENETIHLRRVHTIKLPDAMIAATALILGADLLTHDRVLQAVMVLETQPNAGL